MNTNELWQAVLGELELSLSKVHFTTWFRNTFIFAFSTDEVIIGVPNGFTKTWLEKKYHKEIHSCLLNLTNVHIRRVTYRVETKKTAGTSIIASNTEIENITQKEETIKTQTEPVIETKKQNNELVTPTVAGARILNAKYTFENFIVGKQNELAHAAAQAVSSHAGGVYNPLFIYGGVGLGKTHLLQAIGNEMRAKNPDIRVLYVTCETFTNDFINSVRSGKARDFKVRYRTVDLLLVDDVQFMTGKEGTQEEFFHTFNELHQNNKQLVFTADRPPKAIQNLESRLASRFECGMIADVGSPDFETRAAILELKCKDKQINIERAVLHLIADAIQNNVRELEGALNKIIAFHQFKQVPFTVDTVKPILQSLQSTPTGKMITPHDILEAVAKHYEVEQEIMVGKSRERRYSHPRQVAMFLLREEMKTSYPSIGLIVGGRDHTTAMHAYEKVSSFIGENEKIQHDIEVIRQRLYSK